MRKLLSVLSSTLQGGVRRGLLFFALLATTTLLAHDFSVNGIYYNYLDGNNVAVTYKGSSYDAYNNEYSGEVTIPENVTYNGTTYSVTSIEKYAFAYCSSFTSVTIPNSVTSIGEWAFADCSSLTSVTIPNSVTSIGYGAFIRCSSLTSITCLGTTPPTLGTNVFNGTKLSAVYIPDNTLSAYQTAWGNEYAFVNNETTLTLHVATPGTLADLIFDAGTRPALVAKLTLTGTLNDADFTCMRETMTSLVDVDLSGITNTSGVNFNGKARLMRIILPTNLTSIGEEAFYYCRFLNSITIPNSVTSIGDYAFFNCYSLTSMTIPNSVTSIGDGAFYDCSSLTTPVYNAHCFAYLPTSFKGAYVIPEGIKQIAGEAFIGCYSLTSVTIPNSITSIGDEAFYSCSFLTSITCEATTPPTLGTKVFTDLLAVYIPDNTLSAYQTAWGDEYAFVNNETTLTLHVATPGTLADMIFDAGTRPVLVPKLTLTGTLNDADFTCMRETMTSLVDVDLSGITNTSGVNFRGKENLVRISLPTNLTSIGADAFRDCSSLTSFTIPNSVTSIEGWAFAWCYLLTSVTIPNSVTSIGGSAFYDCSSLTSISIPNSVTSIGSYAFGLCRFTSVTIPNSVTSIGDGAFYSCESLTSITIGNSVTSIGEDTFESCRSLTSITCLGTTPPKADNLGANTSICKLIVPHSAYNAYLRHAYWGQFLNIVADSWVVILNTNNNQWGEVAGGGMYTDNTTITITATPYDGYSFLHWSDGNTDNPRTLTVTKDITLTAEFVEYRDMTIIFTNSEDNDSEIYSQSLTLTIPAAPEIAGFTFRGWKATDAFISDVITIQAIYEADVPSSAPEVYTNPANPAQKLLRNGQVYILQDGKTYTVMGATIQ